MTVPGLHVDSHEWLALAAALDAYGPAPCEGSTLPADAWFRPADEDLAVRVCRGCPVVVECRAYALAAGEREGVWGALGPAERHGPALRPRRMKSTVREIFNGGREAHP